MLRVSNGTLQRLQHGSRAVMRQGEKVPGAVAKESLPMPMGRGRQLQDVQEFAAQHFECGDLVGMDHEERVAMLRDA